MRLASSRWQPAAKTLVLFSVLKSFLNSNLLQELSSNRLELPLDRSPGTSSGDNLQLRPWFSVHLPSFTFTTMGKQYRSPAKKARSILRLLDYKQAYLEDCWGADIIINQQAKKIIWKPSTTLNLTLEQNVRIVETRNLYNPSFAALSFSEKLSIFQKMWKPDQDSLNFFTCMHEHIKRNSIKCNNFCGGFSSPYCGRLSLFFSSGNWPVT